MQTTIKDIREITDSKEMYETKPHPFLSFFIYILMICIVGAGIWTYFGEIDIVSKGIGVVRPNENVSRIRNKVQGEVIESYMKEGKYVEKGDVLFSVGYEDLTLQLNQAENLLKEAENKLRLLIKLRDSVLQDTNLFSKNTEKEYYDRFLKYQQDYESLKNTLLIESKTETMTINQTEANRKLYKDKIVQYEKKIKELEEYKTSIEAEENMFEDKACALSLEFNTYLYKMHELKNTVNDRQITYDLNVLLDKDELIAKKELDDSKIALEYAQNEMTKLKLQTIGSIKNQLNELDSAKEMAITEQSKLIVDEKLLNANDKGRKLSVEKFQTDILVNLYNQIDEQQLLYQTREKEVASIKLAIEDCKMTAPINGTLHITQEVNKGDLIGSGTDIATIIPTNDSMYKVEIFMPNRDIAGIKRGDTIKYKFDALPYKEYGQLEGTITNISVDARTNDASGVSGYLVEGSIANTTVYSYKGDSAEIKVGMTCEAHVITEQKKILYYLLEKINLME